METSNVNLTRTMKQVKTNIIPTVRAFVIRAPTLEATSHLTIDMPGDGPSAPNWLAIVTIDAMPHHRSIHPVDRMYTTVCTECNALLRMFRAQNAPFSNPPKPPNCIISTPKIDADQTESAKILCATVHKNRWPD